VTKCGGFLARFAAQAPQKQVVPVRIVMREQLVALLYRRHLGRTESLEHADVLGGICDLL